MATMFLSPHQLSLTPQIALQGQSSWQSREKMLMAMTLPQMHSHMEQFSLFAPVPLKVVA
jgi:hypothetical protein